VRRFATEAENCLMGWLSRGWIMGEISGSAMETAGEGQQVSSRSHL
jgi:hypothetical protein